MGWLSGITTTTYRYYSYFLSSLGEGKGLEIFLDFPNPKEAIQLNFTNPKEAVMLDFPDTGDA